MSLQQLLEQLNRQTAQSFITAARNIIDALLVEAERIHEQQPPAAINYDGAALSRTAPAGGWLSRDELRAASQRMSEALAAEHWLDGVLVALRALNGLGV